MGVEVGQAPQGEGNVDRGGPSAGAPAQVSRRATLAGGAMALAASVALPACSTAPRPVAARPRPVESHPAFTSLANGASGMIVAGERLDVDLLRRFYARHGFQPVWTNRQAQADALANAVLRAADHGLDPELFHASLLQRRASFPPIRRELLLTHAVLSYADALASGSVPVGRRGENEALVAEPIDVTAALDAAIGSPDPAASIEALAPATPTYRALREALRKHRAGAPAAAARLRAIEVNLERQRWLPRHLPAERVWVNVADQRLVYFREEQPVFSTRVIVGDDAPRNQSPEFRATIEASFLNPPWVIPADIVEAEILPLIRRDPNYLARNNMALRPNGEVEQQPGPNAGLGLIMFDMPNRFDVYLHDTPDRHLFGRGNRRISHGCIRVQNPIELAALLMRQPADAIRQGIAAGGTTRHSLPAPVPVFVTYETAFAEKDGAVAFRPDFYNRDAKIWRQMKSRD